HVSPLAGILRDEFSFILIFLLTFVPPFLPIGTALRSLSSETRAVRFLEAACRFKAQHSDCLSRSSCSSSSPLTAPASAAGFASSRWIPTMEEDRYAIRL